MCMPSGCVDRCIRAKGPFSLSLTGPTPLATADLSIAIFYNIANSSIDAARGKHDIVGGMAAGAVSGAVFKASGKSPTYGRFWC